MPTSLVTKALLGSGVALWDEKRDGGFTAEFEWTDKMIRDEPRH